MGVDELEYRILGQLEVTGGSEAHSITAFKERALLACLLLRRREVVSRDAVIDALWAARPPRTAAKLVQHYVSHLRRALGDGAIETLAAGYRLNVGQDRLDADVFEGLLEEAREAQRAGDARVAASLLDRALGLWRGPALADVRYESFAGTEARRLEELRVVALEQRLRLALGLGRHEEVLADASALVAEHPLHEGLRACLVLALYRAGRHADALAQCRDARRRSVDELGIEPGAELRRLERAVLERDPAIDRDRVDRVRHPPLPLSPTPLVGRARELGTLRQLVRDPEARLVTLTGAGGSGKTRLALELARAVAPELANGAYLVELANVREGRLALSAVAQALDVAERPDEPLVDTIATWLSEREVLLVLDNVEQLVPDVVELSALTAAAPRATILTTSRRVLHLRGERILPVGPLDEPDAVRLFLERAEALTPGFAAAHAQDPTLARICARVDGLPLAIELAAARTTLLEPDALLDRLTSTLTLLVGGARDLPARQRTLRDTLAWSIELLGSGERRTLARAGVFSGGFTLAAAEDVCADGDVVGALSALLELSLARRRSDAERRYELLETVREYAVELLETSGEAEETRRRHARHYLELAERLRDQVEAAGTLGPLGSLDAERENLRGALDTLGSPRGQVADGELRMVAALWRWWWLRGLLSEGRRTMAVALSRASEPSLTRARALRGASVLALRQGDLDDAEARARESVSVARALGADVVLAQALMALGNVAVGRGDYDAADESYTESRVLFERTDASWDRAILLLNIGDLALNRGDYTAVETFAAPSLEYFRERGDDAGAAANLGNLAFAALEEGRVDRASGLLVEGARRAHALGFGEWLASSLLGLAAVAARCDDPARSATLLGAAQRIREESGARLQRYEADLARRTESQARETLGAEAWSAAVGRGTSLEPEAALAYATEGAG